MKNRVLNLIVLIVMIISGLPGTPSTVQAASANSDDSIQHPLESAYATIQTRDGYDTLTIEKEDFSHINDPGNPNLPVQTIRLILPPHVTPQDLKLRIRGASRKILSGRYDIEPAAPAVTEIDGVRLEDWGTDKDIHDGKNRNVYGSRRLYPASHIKLQAVGSMRGWKIAEIAYYPYRYNPVTKRLYHSIGGTLEVKWQDKTDTVQAAAVQSGRVSVSMQHASARPRKNKVFDAARKRIAANYQSAQEKWYADETQVVYSQVQSAGSSTSSAFSQQAGSSASAADYSSAAADDTGYYILTTQEIKDSSSELNNFIAHKESKGFRVKVFTEASWGNKTGDEGADAIREFLQNNYARDNVAYVLLIGNPHPETGDVPMKMCWPRSNAEEKESDYTAEKYQKAPTDYYYAELSGDWDPNDNGLYGEDIDRMHLAKMFDRYPEVYVGRIPYYGQINDLDTILDRTIRYENGEYAGDWLKRILLSVKPSYVSDNPSENTPGYQCMEYIKEELSSQGFAFVRVYDEAYGLNPVPEYYPTNITHVTEAWNEHAGMHFWWTHGSATSASSIMSSTNVDNIDPGYPSIVMQGSCSNGDPTSNKNLGYTLLAKRAIGTVSASSVSWYQKGETPYIDDDYNGGLGVRFTLKIVRDILPLADALFYTKLEKHVSSYSSWMNHLVYNVYGDPSLRLYASCEEAPTIAANLTPRSGDIPLTVSFDGSASTDSKGEKLSYMWDFGNGAYSNSAQGEVTYTSAGTYTLKLTVTNASGMSAVQTYAISANKTESVPPVVTISYPQNNATVSSSGFTFSGTVGDESGIKEILVYIYDYGTNKDTVSKKPASYSKTNGTWSYAVQSSDVSPGNMAFITVVARDSNDNEAVSYCTVTVSDETVTDTKAPVVTISSPQNNATVANTGFTFSGTVQDESAIKEVRVYVKDYRAGTWTVSNQLATYSQSNNSWSYAVGASHVSAGYKARLYVRAKDEHGNASNWKSHTVTVEKETVTDTKAPVVAISSPQNNATVANTGFTFSGTVQDDSAIKEVRIYVHDHEQNKWTVSNQTATYSQSTGSWSYAVGASDVSDGSRVRLYVRAKDEYGNTSSWKWHSVTVEEETVTDTKAPIVAISLPQSNATVASTGFTFSGTVQDESDIKEVLVKVLDYGTYTYTVSDEKAVYSKSSGSWSFVVKPEYITAGKTARLYVQAIDVHGNTSSRIYHSVTVEEEQVTDTTKPVVKVTSPAYNASVSSKGFRLSGSVEDESDIKEVLIQVYDYGTYTYTVNDEKATHSNSSGSWSFTVSSEDITAGKTARIYVEATDVHGNTSSRVTHKVAVEEEKVTDTKKPVVKVTSPANNASVSSAGFTLSGTVEDESDIKEVLIRVYDWGTFKDTVNNEKATHSNATGSWSFAVKPEHITAGKSAWIYVEATDVHGNESSRVWHIVTVEEEKVTDTTKPVVKVISPAYNASVSRTGFTLSGTVEDESDIKEVLVKVYDYGTYTYTVNDEKATHSNSSGSWSFTVSSEDITAGKTARIYVEATDVHGNTSSRATHSVTVEEEKVTDTKAPVVTISSPQSNATVSSTGFTVTGSVADESDIKEVIVKIYDSGVNNYTVSSAKASYSKFTGSWSYAVKSEHITPGKIALVRVQATDAHGNTSSWQSHWVTVSQ